MLKVEADLDALVQSGVLEPVTTSEWAMPLVPVSRKVGEFGPVETLR